MRYLILIYFLSCIMILSCQSKSKEATSKSKLDSLAGSTGKNADQGDEILDNDDEYYNVDPADSAYHAFRTETAIPPYGLDKIKSLIKGIESVTNEDEWTETEAMNDTAYNSLTFREKFTYHMIHPESYSQICDFILPPKKSAGKIFAYLPDGFGEYNWSERQKKFLEDSRDSVMVLIKESVLRTKRIKLNYKQAIVEISGKEMIPLLIETYNANTKDGDILTVLLLLMKGEKYKPFVSSQMYKKLYSVEEDYETFIDLTNETRDQIIKWTTGFYNESHN